MIQDILDSTPLANGKKIPMLGFGTWQLADGAETRNAVAAALEIGYRHIDTAAIYDNESSVGAAVRESGIPREEIFITTKCWTADIRTGYEAVIEACRQSLRRLDTDYVDLYLLHWPIQEAQIDAWRALEKLYRDGLTRAIGVSNYLAHHLESLFESTEIRPMVNQVEFHPHLLQPELMQANRNYGIVQEAWSPLMQGRVPEIPEIRKIAESHGKTPAQVVLRWNLQHGIVTIPKSARRERIAENANLYDFELTDEEMRSIDALDRNSRIGEDPDQVDF